MASNGKLEQTEASGQEFNELLAEAKKSIISAEQVLATADETANQHYRAAADRIAQAQEEKTSQRQIADAIGKSAAYVNQLLRWRKEGYHNSPFGPQSSAARARKKERSGATERAPNKSTTADKSARADSEGASGNAAKKKTAKTNVESDDRNRLVKLLGLLGSDHDSECLNAARKAEKRRKTLGLTWDELIVPAKISYASAA